MRRILKFTIQPERTEVRTADEPTWLAVGAQGTDVVAWCEATPGAGVITVLVGMMTGESAQLGPDRWARYVGTATQSDGIVVHVYRGPTVQEKS